jgi:hypothetical protein
MMQPTSTNLALPAISSNSTGPLVGGSSFYRPPATSASTANESPTTPALGSVLEQVLGSVNQLVAALSQQQGRPVSSMPPTNAAASAIGGGPQAPPVKHTGEPGCTCGCRVAQPDSPPASDA